MVFNLGWMRIPSEFVADRSYQTPLVLLSAANARGGTDTLGFGRMVDRSQQRSMLLGQIVDDARRAHGWGTATRDLGLGTWDLGRGWGPPGVGARAVR